MSELFSTGESKSPQNFDKFSIPLKFGLLAGFVMIFMTTINFLYILKWNFIAFGAFALLTYIVPVIFYAVTGVQQRKAMGGYITIKEAFQAIFVVILISIALSSIYGLIYFKFIDPEMISRMKETALAFFQKMNMPQEKIDEQMNKIDQQTADSLKIGPLLYATAKSIVLNSIFGFICALIVKKNKPLSMEA